MEGEIENYIKAWVQVILSLCYCYAVGKLAPKGVPRLLALVPVTCHFLALPLTLHSLHLAGTFAFFITWLANFKLFLFAFGKGPLSRPSLSLSRFVAFACFAVRISDRPFNTSENARKSLLIYAVKALLFAAVVRAYHYSDFMHHKVLLSLYCVHLYLILEAILGVVGSLARTLGGIEMEPHFDEPYLSSSLQDFWGRRWNVVVTNILRPTVYEPVLHMFERRLGRNWASLPAVGATFLVSGLMHELIFFYLGRTKPTWEVTWFFLLHGLCLLVELAVKMNFPTGFQLPRVVSGIMTVGFVMCTAFWLFFPPLLRCQGPKRTLEEYAAVGAFVKNLTGALAFNAFNS